MSRGESRRLSSAAKSFLARRRGYPPKVKSPTLTNREWGTRNFETKTRGRVGHPPEGKRTLCTHYPPGNPKSRGIAFLFKLRTLAERNAATMWRTE
jgi:hypothetical protein